MSIESQIEASWKDGEPWIADDDYPMVPKEQLLRLIKEMFKDGYLANMKHIADILYVEVTESRLDHGGEYYALRDGEWRFCRAIEIGDGRFNFVGQSLNEVFPASEAERIVFESGIIPSPSDIFGIKSN